MIKNVDILQGGRDEMRGLGARFVSPFLRGFSPALPWLVFVGLVFLFVWLCLL